MKITKIFYNGAVYTVDGTWTKARAIALEGPAIAAVGTDEQILALKEEGTEVIDLKGKMVLPGFVDSHAHPSWGGTELLYKVDLFNCKDAEEYPKRIAAFIEENPNLECIQGVGWVNPHFPPEGPSRFVLDAIRDDIPMAFDSGDHHSVWANSKAIEMAGIDKDTPCPEGGVIEKDPRTGELTGTFREAAQDLVRKVIPDYSAEEYMAGILKYQEVMASYGITMSHDAMVDGDGPAYEALLRLEKEDKMLFKMNASFTTYPEDPFKDAEQYGRYLAETDGTMLKGKHLKIFVDGVVEACTAWLKEPYANRPDYCGEPVWDEEELKKVLVLADKQGMIPHFHVIGDRAVQQMLDVLEYVERVNGPKERMPLAAHVQLLDPADLPRMKKLGVAVSADPYWYVKDPGYYCKLELPFLGEERVSKEYPMKTFFDAGLTVASASDYSVTPVPKPLRGIQMGMNRCYPEMDIEDPECVLGKEERVSLRQMIESFTINGAKVLGRAGETGSIEPGKDADLVILEKDLFELPITEIAFTKVCETICRGKTIYRG
ncbi:amidohydrolase [Anaerovorax odorimutans]|uniref:Amidohydrolase n=1 Tax=Anaerovorax odorimutans TaxID=109327 RepID=A0ABT1RN45_9FIRM|nr:amidohydrolase family protein [Anaerovorax odorimutans]MCQ4636602.1 amidohydrolase [Anaerovorax odorimutans]